MSMESMPMDELYHDEMLYQSHRNLNRNDALFHDYGINMDKNEVIDLSEYDNYVDYHPSEINEVFPPEDELVDEEDKEWVEEFEDKVFEDIVDYLDAKRKILNGDITEIHIEMSFNSAEGDRYNFKWR